MPSLGYQDYLLPKKLQSLGHETVIITSDRFTPIPNYNDIWGPIMGPRMHGPGEFLEGNMLIIRLEPTFEIQRRIKLKGLYRRLKKIQPDYLFVHNILSMNIPTALRYSRENSIPIYVDSHLTFTSTNTTLFGIIYYWFVKKYYKRRQSNFTSIYGVAEECREHLSKYIGIPITKSSLLPIGIDEELFRYSIESRQNCRDKYQVRTNEILLMTTGKLCEEKGTDLIPKIIALLPIEMRKLLRVVMVGDGSSEFVKSKIKIPFEKIDFKKYSITGFVDYTELPNFFAGADIVVYPRASSLSALEAAACRNIVLMSDTEASRWREYKGVGFSLNFSDLDLVVKELSKFIKMRVEEREAVAKKAELAAYHEFSYKSIAQHFIQQVQENT